MENIEKRIHPRKPAQFPVEMSFHGQDYPGVLLNISQEGAFLKLEHRGNIPVGHIHADIQLREPEDRILAGFQVNGVLVRAFAGEDGSFYCAIRFLGVLNQKLLDTIALPLQPCAN